MENDFDRRSRKVLTPGVPTQVLLIYGLIFSLECERRCQHKSNIGLLSPQRSPRVHVGSLNNGSESMRPEGLT